MQGVGEGSARPSDLRGVAPHPLLSSDLLDGCAATLLTVARYLAPQCIQFQDGGGSKRRWAATLDLLQGTDLSSLVEDESIRVLDPSFVPVAEPALQSDELMKALGVFNRTNPSLSELLQRYVVAIIPVRRNCQGPSALDSIDMVAATHGLWRPVKGGFVGSSTGHLGLLWVEMGLRQNDLVCSVVHEFVHLALNLVDMAVGIFTDAAYNGSLQAISPILKVPRPYALAMHAFMVKSVLEHLGMRMSSERPGSFVVEEAVGWLNGSADQALTAQGKSLFDAVRAHFGHRGNAVTLRLVTSAGAIESYKKKHAKPTLLLNSESYRQKLELQADLCDAGMLCISRITILEDCEDDDYVEYYWREQNRTMSIKQYVKDMQGRFGKTIFEYSVHFWGEDSFATQGLQLREVGDLHMYEVTGIDTHLVEESKEKIMVGDRIIGVTASTVGQGYSQRINVGQGDTSDESDCDQEKSIEDVLSQPGNYEIHALKCIRWSSHQEFCTGTLTVAKPWCTRYADIAVHLDNFERTLNFRHEYGGVTMSSELLLPGGRRHVDAKADPELTVAVAFALPPSLFVTVLAEPDEGRLACFMASGARLGALAVPNPAIAFQELERPLAAACGLVPEQVMFITAEGKVLRESAEYVAALFGLKAQVPSGSDD